MLILTCPGSPAGFHPVRNGHRANVATFANQINNGPVSLACLDVMLDSLDAANPRSQIGTQQASGGGFVSQATHGCKLLVDGVGGQVPRFQVHAIAHHDDAVEGQPRLGAAPGDELVDGVLVDSARSWRAETVEYCQLAVIQVWQPKHSAMIAWFCFAFAHANGLPRRRNGTTAGVRLCKLRFRDGSRVLSQMA